MISAKDCKMAIGNQEIKGMDSWSFETEGSKDFLEPTESISFTANYAEAEFDFLSMKGKPIKVYPDENDESNFYEAIVKDIIKTEDGYDLITERIRNGKNTKRIIYR